MELSGEFTKLKGVSYFGTNPKALVQEATGIGTCITRIGAGTGLAMAYLNDKTVPTTPVSMLVNWYSVNTVLCLCNWTHVQCKEKGWECNITCVYIPLIKGKRHKPCNTLAILITVSVYDC